MTYEFTKAKINREQTLKRKSLTVKILLMLFAGAIGAAWGHWMLSWSMPFVFIPGIFLSVIAGVLHSANDALIKE